MLHAKFQNHMPSGSEQGDEGFCFLKQIEELYFLMLHANFKSIGLLVLEKILKVFDIYSHCGHLGHVPPSKSFI